ncbi:MAG: SurA N-terminal domain-containing protein [Deltaproteobacteria bacterium]|nr:SurA N-terminal domain-containing protein [Deltaproteobacteria bacterium]
MISKRFKSLILAPLLLAILLGLAVVAFQRHYRRQLWDPETVAMVNGQPLPKSAIEEIIVLGYHQPLALSEGGDGQLLIRQILDRLVDEELIRQEAEKEGLEVDGAQVEENLAGYRRSFGCDHDRGRAVCQAAVGSSGESLAKAVEKQLLLRAMAERVYRSEARPNSRDWRVFWRDYLARYSFSSVYRVRVLLAQEGQEALKILGAPGRGGLEQMAERLREAGLEVRLAGPLSLNLMDPETFREFRSVGLGLELAKAMGHDPRLTQPIRLSGSLSVFEVIEVIKPIDPVQLAKAAQNAYERQVGERAFDAWLARLRSNASIVVNPNLLESAEAGGIAEAFRPRVPWAGETAWDAEDPKAGLSGPQEAGPEPPPDAPGQSLEAIGPLGQRTETGFPGAWPELAGQGEGAHAEDGD